MLAFGGNRTSGPIDVATALSAHGGPHGRIDFESETFLVADTVRSHPRPGSNSLGGVLPFETTQLSSPGNYSAPKPGDPCHPLPAEGHPPAVVVMQERMESANPDNGPNGKGWSDEGVAFTMEGRRRPQAVAIDARQDPSWYDEHTGAHGAQFPPHAVAVEGMTVRRITPKDGQSG